MQDSIKEGEVALIYFSGHGDMETKTFSKFGYLLCYDSPPHNYKVGAYAVQFLQDIVSTIASRNAKIIMISDACHSGKLAGNAIGGTQATAEMLIQKLANEIKLMSCQPHETSIEGQQWGGGRGVFSYFLEKALNGFADFNNDHIISLAELNLYLTSKIPEEIFPRSQTPIVEGDQRILLARVDSLKMAKAKSEENTLVQTK
ncbi:MAG: caspase family protein [Saprospiraceae bacterium]|nr:caspase family protein [Saprospiraceae bacterium]